MRKGIENLKELSNKATKPAKASVWYTLCSIIQKMIGLFFVPLYVRLMTTEEYGIYTLAQSWESIILVFATLNLASYAFQNCLIKDEKNLDKVTGFFLGLLLTVAVICSGVFLLFLEFWEEAFGITGKYIIAIALDSFFIVALDIWYAAKKFDYSYRGVAIVTIGISVITLAAGICLVPHSLDKAFTAILVKLAAQGMAAVVLMADVWKKGRCFFDKGLWKYALCFNIPLIPHFLSMRVLQQADRIMIQKFCGTSHAGIYGFSYKISEVMLIFNSAVLSSLIPWTYKKLKDEDYRGIFGKAAITIFLIGVLNFTLILVAPEVVAVLGTAEYQEAVYIIPPIAMSNLLIYLFNVFANVTYYYEQNKLIMAASVAASFLNIGLNWIFIPRLGYLAAGYTTLASYMCLAVMHGIMYRYTLKIKGIYEKIYNLKKIVLLVTGMMGAGIGCTFLYKGFIWRYAIVAGIAGGVVMEKEKIKEICFQCNSGGKTDGRI